MKLVKPENDFEPVHAMVIQSISAKAVLAAVELKVFDMLGEERSLEVLAKSLGLVSERLESMLDILVAVKLLEKHGDQYINTPVAMEFLVSSEPLYQGLSIQLTMQFISSIENSISELVAGGDVDRDTVDEKWGAADVMDGTAQDALGSGLLPVIEVVTGLPGFNDFRTMCDIGGNHGSYLMGVLDQNDDMNGVLFDLPPVAEQAQARCNALGYEGRITTTGLDFRSDNLPVSGFDLALTSHFLYVFKDDLTTVLKRIAESLRPGGWFVSHHYAGDGGNKDRLTSASLELLTRLCGYPSHFIEREELVDALSGAGFEDVRFQPVSPTGFGLITVAQWPK